MGNSPIGQDTKEQQRVFEFSEQHINENEAPSNDPIIIYTDGSCLHYNSTSAVGCFFGLGHPLNFGKQLHVPDNVPEHDNNVAEIMAAQMALEKLLAWPHSQHNTRPVVIRTDSLYIVNNMNQDPLPCRNRFAESLHRLKDLKLKFPLGVAFEHVPAHSNVDGNEQADQLARDALNIERGPRSRSWSGRSRSRSRSGLRGSRRSRSNFVPGRERF